MREGRCDARVFISCRRKDLNLHTTREKVQVQVYRRLEGEKVQVRHECVLTKTKKSTFISTITPLVSRRRL